MADTRPDADTPATHDDSIEDDLVARRAELSSDEKEAGSEDALAQARAILEDSDARTADLEAAPGTYVEHRHSEDTVPPPD
jgi:hypothetical protein